MADDWPQNSICCFVNMSFFDWRKAWSIWCFPTKPPTSWNVPGQMRLQPDVMCFSSLILACGEGMPWGSGGSWAWHLVRILLDKLYHQLYWLLEQCESWNCWSNVGAQWQLAMEGLSLWLRRASEWMWGEGFKLVDLTCGNSRTTFRILEEQDLINKVLLYLGCSSKQIENSVDMQICHRVIAHEDICSDLLQWAAKISPARCFPGGINLFFSTWSVLRRWMQILETLGRKP